jgi:uncharacterized protein YkwD
LLLARGRAAGVFARDRTAAAAASYCPTADERQLLTLINDYRQKHGKHALTLSAALGAAAEFHSQDLAKRSRIKGHDLTNGDSARQNLRRFGFKGNEWGENLAWEAPDAATAFSRWQKSPDHRRNMLNGKFRAIGIGYFHDPNAPFIDYWTTGFGDDGGPGPPC